MGALGLKLDEVILYVEDMAAQTRFYRDVMGMAVGYASEHWTTFPGGGCTLALHAGGQRRFGADAPKFVFSVADVAAAREALVAKGVRLGEPRPPAPGVTVVDGLDPEGNKFSLEHRA